MCPNKEGVVGPSGRPWSNTTFHEQLDHGAGLLNNAIYKGELEWNKCCCVKNPRTCKRIAHPNPPAKWERQKVKPLRIIDNDFGKAQWQTRALSAAKRWRRVF